MIPFEVLPWQTEGIKLIAGENVVLTFPVTFDYSSVSIASARFGIKRTFGGDYISNIVCTVSGSTCVANVGTLSTAGNYIGELTVTLNDGNVYTPLQFPIVIQ